MKTTRKYDVFISYRRKGGHETALLLYQTLVRAGYRVAYDIETLLGDEFEPQIMDTIEHCKDVLVVLGPDALDRCADPRDLLRREIAKALLSPCRVIPVLLAGFVFPPAETLPPDIRKLPAQNGIAASMPHFDSTFAQIRKLLSSKPRWFKRPRVWTALLAAFAAALLALAAAFIHRVPSAPAGYPATRAEVQRVNRVVAHLTRQTEACQEAAAARATLVAKARRAAELSRPAILADALPLFRHDMAAAMDKFSQTRPDPALLSELADSPIPVDVLSALFDNTAFELADALQTLPKKLAFYADPASALSAADRLDCIDRAAELERLHAQWFTLGVFELFLDVSPSALADFKKLVPAFTSLPRLSQPWPADKAQLDIEQQTVIENIQRALNETAALAGRLNLEVSGQRATLESILRQAGASPEEASAIVSRLAAPVE